ncbi:G-protein coupled receptor dmsr-1-like [Crassostrea virginica]|uniref:Sex peptide receptor-like n=1 Tax=Crassostrea virginica TaxID=6565 RepID=A0A8B8A670_CRAVI|nr:sex peptide receptor-like [Crassostrea virginica]XP_022286961.1 sex peptide receptor-like [Crassostrea virginica]XP_022286962.1 sex peptide receptor-like [Crassostrea virginica]XP_022286964.1 sex peptide receptor-like [Crassostrea virginica]XP_022286965.1 sex peptide receptor-like [Crassostrea virginica]XP_022286966.1 sex peptide receptor-like [Crassostrea virginica]
MDFMYNVQPGINNGSGNFTVTTIISESPTKDDFQSLTDFYFNYAKYHGYISVFVCIFGIIANFANIVVLTRKNMITSVNIILTWLAVADTLKMLDYLPFVTKFYILKDPNLEYFQTRSYSAMLFLLFHASFSIVCHTVAVWLTIALAIFRFLFIWFPTRGNAWCSPFRAKCVIFCVYISIIILTIPNYAINSYHHEIYNGTDFYKSAKSESLRDTWFDDTNQYIHSILFKLVPCFMLTILTLLLIYAMHKAYKKRRQLKSVGRKEDADRHHEHNRTTGMLLAVVVMFLITELPQGILTLIVSSEPEWEFKVYNKLGDVLDIVALCNNAVNFVLYCSMSKQFRDTFVRIFCRCCPQEGFGFLKVKLNNTANGNKNYMATLNNGHNTATFV